MPFFGGQIVSIHWIWIIPALELAVIVVAVAIISCRRER